jgi:hypothetical protein
MISFAWVYTIQPCQVCLNMYVCDTAPHAVALAGRESIVVQKAIGPWPYAGNRKEPPMTMVDGASATDQHQQNCSKGGECMVEASLQYKSL